MKNKLKRLIVATVIIMATVSCAEQGRGVLAPPVQTRATGNHLLDQNSEGKLFYNGNELKNVSTISQGDAAFYKTISPYVSGGSGGGGGFSMDVGDEGRNVPVVELLGSMYQDGGEFKLVLLRKGVGTNPNDSDYLTVLECSTDRCDFRVPITTPGGGAGGVVDTMWSPDGMSFTQQQSDGNFVTYGASTPFSKANATALWSAWTGFIRTRALVRDAGVEPFSAPRP